MFPCPSPPHRYFVQVCILLQVGDVRATHEIFSHHTCLHADVSVPTDMTTLTTFDGDPVCVWKEPVLSLLSVCLPVLSSSCLVLLLLLHAFLYFMCICSF